MRFLSLPRGLSISLTIFLLAAPTQAEAPPKNATEKLPKISDEPQTIDPAQYYPEPLRKKVTIDFDESSLGEAVQWLKSEQSIVALVQQDALKDLGYLPGDPWSDKLTNEPIYLMLNRLQALDMGWYFEDEILHVTTQNAAFEHVTTQPYNIGKHLDAGYTADDLIDTIISTLASDSWVENGGPHGAISLLGDVLFVRQNDREHRQLRCLLVALLEHGRRTLIADPIQHQILRQKLQQQVTLNLRDRPLESAIAKLAEQSGADLRLDQAGLDELGLRKRQPVSISIAERDLSTVLQAMLIDLSLTYVIRDGVIWITSQDEALNVQKTAVFDVRDLCRDADESVALVDAIMSQTSDVWVDYGGQSELRMARPGTLVAYATEPTLDDVLHLLENYRTALRSSKPRQATKPLDMQEVITVYYRMDTAVADSLQRNLPFLVAKETWRPQPDAIGTILKVASRPDLTQNITPDSNTVAATPKSVLVITNTREVHEQVREVIQRVEFGDQQQGKGFGGGASFGGGGGFGGGFFAVPQQDQVK